MSKLQQWVTDVKLSLTQEEKDLLDTPRSEEKIKDTIKYNQTINEYFNRLPDSGLARPIYTITVSDSCTSLIQELFKKEVDNNTFVVTSSREHDVVKAIFDNIPNERKVQVDTFDEGVASFLVERMQKANCNKVFIYYIGTEISNGHITPQSEFELLKNYLVEHNIEHEIVLDDCQGMFWVKRNYTIFDYILATAHANSMHYNMGICISKKGNVGEKVYNWLHDYLAHLDIFLSRKKMIYDLWDILREEVDNRLNCPHYIYLNGDRRFFSLSVDHPIEATEEELDELDNYDMWLYDELDKVRIRCQQYIQFPDFIIPGIELIVKLVNGNK